jgi:tetratricopeptide (TPR) repeat protein
MNMRSKDCLLWLAVIGILVPAALWAKFGMIKTHVAFLMHHPPAFVAPGRELRVDASSVDPRYAPLAAQAKGLLQQRLMSEDYKPLPSAQTVLTFTINDAGASVGRVKRMTTISLHTGSHYEYDKNGKGREVEDCKYFQQAEVTFLVSDGRMGASLSVTDAKTQASLFSQVFSPTYHSESQVAGPQQCGGVVYGVNAGQLQSPDAILRSLLETNVTSAMKLVAGYDERRDVLLAVDRELKPGNAAALAGNWMQALEAWKGAPASKRNVEAAQQYNEGVAHEALAAAAMRNGSLDDANSHLAGAEKCYQQALSLDSGEKYFRDTLTRLQHDRQVLQSEETHAFEKQTANMASAPPPPSFAAAPVTSSIPLDGWPDEPETTHNYRQYVRVRLAAERDSLTDAFKQSLKADANDYQVPPAVALQVIESEENRMLVVKQNQDKYRQLFEGLVKDGVISKVEREILRNRQETLHLSDAQVKEVEAQFHFQENQQ